MTPLAFLFDLDGTLVDSAPDLVGAINRVREREGLAPLDTKLLAPYAGKGAPGLVGKAFDQRPGDADYDRLRAAFLEEYSAYPTRDTTVYPGVIPLLTALKESGVRLGVMTNKYERFALDVVNGMGLGDFFEVVIGSDSEGSAMKPDPAGLLEAARRLEVDPQRTLYAGDDLRDMVAAKNAGMSATVVGWGYCPIALEDCHSDHISLTPEDVLAWARTFQG